MLAKRYALINADGVVVNCIIGTLTPQQEQMILAAESNINGATQILGVEPDTMVWIGGSYDAAQGFLPLQQPESIDGTATIMPIEQPIELQEQV